MFLTEDDFKTIIEEDKLSKIIGDNPSLLLDAILIAIEEMSSYLSGRYDVATAFEKVSTDRNMFLVMRGADIALYHLYSRIAPRNIPELRGIRYAEAIEWLKSINKGNVHINLPVKSIDNHSGYILFGGNPTFKTR